MLLLMLLFANRLVVVDDEKVFLLHVVEKALETALEKEAGVLIFCFAKIFIEPQQHPKPSHMDLKKRLCSFKLVHIQS